MQITDRQRKQIWIGAAVIAVLYLGPPLVNAFRQAFASHEAVIAKPSPAHPAPVAAPAPDPAAVKVAAVAAQFNKLTGNWSGGGFLPEFGGICRLNLQIRTIPEKPASYSGYATTICNPALATMGKRQSPEKSLQAIAAATTPTSAIMTGTVEDNHIAFHIDQNIDTRPGECALTSFTVFPFADQIAAQWQACRSGNLVLNRVSSLK
jgi:hypothetical protein